MHKSQGSAEEHCGLRVVSCASQPETGEAGAQAQAASGEAAATLPGPVCAAAPASTVTIQDQAPLVHHHADSDENCTSSSQQPGLHEAGNAAGQATQEQQAGMSALSLVDSAAARGDTVAASDGLSTSACGHSIAWAGLAPSSCSPQPIPEGYGDQPDADVADGECVVCWASAASVIFQPCGHFCTCHACAQPYLCGGLCMMCRQPITSSLLLD